MKEGAAPPYRIMIVDDEEKIRSVYKRFLSLERYEVIEAPEWETAVKLLARQNRIDMILLDINMPVVDGAALYEVIHRHYPSIKVIVTSAYPLEDQKHLIAQADDYFDKSHGTEVLLKKIKAALGAP